MSLSKAIALVFAAALLAACTTPYQRMGLTGGYSEKQISGDVWHVHYVGNGLTTLETVQTMWLYRCASLTLEKGFAGFEIVKSSPLTELRRGQSRPVCHASSFSSSLQAAMPDIIGQTVGNMVAARAPTFDGDIRLINLPFTPVPGKVFDAAALKALLEPLVTVPKCKGNVCPHPHTYLGVENSTAH